MATCGGQRTTFGVTSLLPHGNCVKEKDKGKWASRDNGFLRQGDILRSNTKKALRWVDRTTAESGEHRGALCPPVCLPVRADVLVPSLPKG